MRKWCQRLTLKEGPIKVIYLEGYSQYSACRIWSVWAWVLLISIFARRTFVPVWSISSNRIYSRHSTCYRSWSTCCRTSISPKTRQKTLPVIPVRLISKWKTGLIRLSSPFLNKATTKMSSASISPVTISVNHPPFQKAITQKLKP